MPRAVLPGAVSLFAYLCFCSQVPASDMRPPIHGLTLKDVRDMFHENRGGRPHEAIDIMSPAGTPVRAVVSGTIRKLFLSKPGGITIYLVDKAGAYCYYYAHLERYAEGLREGMEVKRGDVIAYVGSTGNADPRAPHLHFTIFEVESVKEWWKGKPVNPYPALIAAVKRERGE